jgi:hypothetical protein
MENNKKLSAHHNLEAKMKVIDLTDEHKQLYFVCLEDWCEEMKEAGNHKELWYNEMKGKGLRVKLALDENEQVGGMIEYISRNQHK